MGLPLYRIFNDEDGITNLFKDALMVSHADPASLSDDYYRINDRYRSNNRVKISRFGVGLIIDVAIDQIADEQGNIISPDVVWEEVHEYLVGLGFNQSGGNVDLSNYYTKAEVDAKNAALQSQIDFILGVIDVEKLDTPTLTAGTPTQTSISLTIGSVPNATYYKIFRDGVEVYSGVAGLQTISGLTPGTEYTFTSQAFADGYAPSDAAEVVVSTLPAGQTQLPAGTLQAGTITDNSIQVIGSVVPNAQQYRFIKNGQAVTTQADPSYIFTGLAASSNFTLGRQAIAIGYEDSPVVQVNATTQAGGQPVNTNIFPFIFPFHFAS